MPAFALAALMLVAVPAADAGDESREGKPGRAARSGPPSLALRQAPAGAPRANAAQAGLRGSLGSQGVLELDPRTGTPRVVAKLDGFLTGRSGEDAKKVVLDYVRARPDVFGLEPGDLADLRLARDYTDVAGVRHLIWAQTYRGIPAFDNDLRASVTSDGRLVNVLGSPHPDLRPATTTPALSGSRALAAALRDVGRPGVQPRVVERGSGAEQATRFAGGHRAGLRLVDDGSGVRLAWRVTARADSDEIYDTLVDASTGEVLRRVNTVESVAARAWDYYPGAAQGGTQADRSAQFVAPWVTDATRLFGANAHVFVDENDDNVADAGENVPSARWDDAFEPTTFQHEAGNCAPAFASACSWDSFSSESWKTFREQNATQVFYFVNTFHDHLTSDPGIGFDGASGAFENTDRVVAHTDDGANQTFSDFLGLDFMPDASHLSNANMFTPPDGRSPRMQMYLFTNAGGGDPTPDVNGGDDASVVYHEYTHGLSSRLVTYADGWAALDTAQAGAMGEGWSDWYAMDYLVGGEFAPDTVAHGDVVLDRYVGNGVASLRTEGLDCPVGSFEAACPGGGGAGAGGYTYGDFGLIADGPEVHADGEIWAQTLWDLRSAVGVADARFLVTEGMRLSPVNPSFLDMRNAILQANPVNVAENGAADRQTEIWQVFAARGMGYFASSVFGFDGDTSPSEDSTLPPDPAQAGSLTGTIRNADTSRPVKGVLVALAGHDSGFLGDLADTTDGSGAYAIPNVPAGDYPELYAFKRGWDEVVVDPAPVVASAATAVPAVELRRDWPSRLAGGRVSAFTGPDNTFFCGFGPEGAIDQAHAVGWPSDMPAGKRIVVKLPAFVDVKAVAVDPGATCGDPPEAALRKYKIEFSKTGASWSGAFTKTFADHSAEGTLDTVTFSRKKKAVRFVRLTMLANWGHPEYIDLSELEVYGAPTPTCLGKPATRVGTNGPNAITGTRRADVILGLGGRDRIDGRGGNDVICGGDGNDRLVGGSGVDRYDGGAGSDAIIARDGRRERKIAGGSGTDRARKDRSDRTQGVERFL